MHAPKQFKLACAKTDKTPPFSEWAPFSTVALGHFYHPDLDWVREHVYPREPKVTLDHKGQWTLLSHGAKLFPNPGVGSAIPKRINISA